MYVFSWFVFFCFLEVTSFKKSLGAGITDPAGKLKKIYMIIDHVSLSFRFTWWFIVFLSSQITWWLDVVFSIFTDVGFLLLVYMIFFWFLPLWSTWSYNVFFSVESVFKFSWRWDKTRPPRDWNGVFLRFLLFWSFFSFLVLFFMSGGDISLTHRGLIGAKTAELPQTLSRVSKLSFCQIERKMLSDRNYLELRK